MRRKSIVFFDRVLQYAIVGHCRLCWFCFDWPDDLKISPDCARLIPPTQAGLNFNFRTHGARGTGTLMNRGKSTTSMVGYPLLSRSGRLRHRSRWKSLWKFMDPLIFAILSEVPFVKERKQVSVSIRPRKEVCWVCWITGEIPEVDSESS